MNKNQKYMLCIILSVIIIMDLIGFFYPKQAGGPLCGPVCPNFGLHYYERNR